MRNLLRGVVVVLLSHSAVTADAQVQGPPRVPATLAIVEDLRGAVVPYQFVRMAGNSPQDVVLLAPDITPQQFTEAVEALLLVRSQSPGAFAETVGRVRVRRNAPSGARRRVLPWADKVLSDLRSAPIRHVPGAGFVRSVQVWLPTPQRTS